MSNSFKSLLLRHISNIPGWRTNRKIVVLESDDWGSIRMPSRKVFESLSLKNIDLISGDSMRYNRYDSLATADDLSLLFVTLQSVKDKNGNPAVFTAISVTSNPDFKKIKESGYLAYFHEPFTETLKRYHGCADSFELWKEGVNNHLFVPEFHGREHLNVQVWMNALRNKDRDTLLAFEQECWGFNNIHPYNISYQAAFELDEPEELQYHHSILKEGLKLFEEIHGYKSRYFVPPNSPINNILEETAAQNGIRYMAASKIQNETLGHGKTRKRYHYIGQKNMHGQYYITRNCFFEPSHPGKDWTNSCLGEIEIAFRMNKPAIISTHRVNYIGAIDTGNRDRSLVKLKELLNGIKKAYPDVEFLTSVQLGNLIKS